MMIWMHAIMLLLCPRLPKLSQCCTGCCRNVLVSRSGPSRPLSRSGPWWEVRTLIKRVDNQGPDFDDHACSDYTPKSLLVEIVEPINQQSQRHRSPFDEYRKIQDSPSFLEQRRQQTTTTTMMPRELQTATMVSTHTPFIHQVALRTNLTFNTSTTVRWAPQLLIVE